MKEHLFAVLRDVVFITHEVQQGGRFDLGRCKDVTNAVFHVLRNARVLERKVKPNLVVCWGGHSISEPEYQYTKKVGYEFGLRGLDVCTGCGPGAMKGPMKGATIGHAKQRISTGRYIGLTEPGIIAAEPPNAIVNQLVIMPDIEKRLEAFVRLAHGVVVFRVAWARPKKSSISWASCSIPQRGGLCRWCSRARAERRLLQPDPRLPGATLGRSARPHQGDHRRPGAVAKHMVHEVSRVRSARRGANDSYNFNWLLRCPKTSSGPLSSPTRACAPCSCIVTSPSTC